MQVYAAAVCMHYHHSIFCRHKQKTVGDFKKGINMSEITLT
jgi:hypothetical protein